MTSSSFWSLRPVMGATSTGVDAGCGASLEQLGGVPPQSAVHDETPDVPDRRPPAPVRHGDV